jgi:hypothetical protein
MRTNRTVRTAAMVVTIVGGALLARPERASAFMWDPCDCADAFEAYYYAVGNCYPRCAYLDYCTVSGGGTVAFGWTCYDEPPGGCTEQLMGEWCD